MNRYILLILLFPACTFFLPRTTPYSTVVRANIVTNIEPFSQIKTTTKLAICSDSITLSAKLPLGIEIVKLVLKGGRVLIYNNISQKKSEFSLLDFDPEIDVVKIIGSLMWL